MKAVLLAAGKGERLGEVTQKTPKPMLPVFGKPVIVHNIEMCQRFGIADIYINLHHLPEVITGYLGDGRRFGVSITYSPEEKILGTAGGVKRLADKLSGERFLVIYADNYFNNYDLGTVYDRHCQTGADMSITLFESENISQSGVALMDEGDWVKKFVEKPEEETIGSHWANAGIYLMEPKLLELIPTGFSDFGNDIIPQYIAAGYKVLGVKMPSPVIAIDTPALLKEVEGQA
jgi:NDP-sugar pyrophosphorylase family protein